ncbi:MAG: hypothetical protein NWR72_02275 [Bacteroidia bacterium]|nr:hypothetical protein [Bacteroidia bacterium]
MHPLHSPQQTFHNLCILAAVDGFIQFEEHRLLMEFADAIGLTPEEAQQIMGQIIGKEVIIPASQVDREIEIRFLVMVAAADGVILPQEQALLFKLAEMMGVSRSYVEQVIAFHLEKQVERLANRAILHNLYLVAKADGEITEAQMDLLLEVAYNLGLAQEDISLVLDHKLPDAFDIPEDKNEQWFSLKNLVFMMILDGEIGDSEYDLCLKYAEAINMGEAEIEDIIEEYQELALADAPEEVPSDPGNLDIVLDIFNQLREPSRSLSALIHAFEVAMEKDDFHQEFDPEPTRNRACLQLMWLMFVRAPSLTHEAAKMIPLHMDLVATKGQWKDLRDYLLGLETQFGNTPIHIHELDEEELRRELVEA